MAGRLVVILGVLAYAGDAACYGDSSVKAQGFAEASATVAATGGRQLCLKHGAGCGFARSYALCCTCLAEALDHCMIGLPEAR